MNIGKIKSKNADLRRSFLFKTKRLFSESLTLGICEKIRLGFQTLSLNVLGTFLLTFGLYTALSSLVLHLLGYSVSSNVSIVSGIIISIVSIPLLFSRDSVAIALSDSMSGSVICKCCGIRTVNLIKSKRTGHINQSFALGVILGTASIVLSTKTVICAILLVLVCAISLSYPMAGVVFAAICVPFGDNVALMCILPVTFLSFAVKLFRGKRSSAVHAPGALYTAFALYFAVRSLFSQDFYSGFGILVLTFIYFLCSLILRNCRDSVLTSVVLVISVGIAAFVYCFGFGVDGLIDIFLPDTKINGAYILSFAEGFAFIKNGSCAAVISACIPLCVGLSLRNDGNLPLTVIWLCTIADYLFLFITGQYMFIILSAVFSLLVLLLAGKRSGFILFGITLVFLSALLYITGLWKKLGVFFAERISYNVSQWQGQLASFSARTFSEKLFGSGSFTFYSDSNLYISLLYSVGIIGAVLFAAFIIISLIYCGKFYIKTIGMAKDADTFYRFDVLRDFADTRLGIVSPLSSLAVLLSGGAFTNYLSSASAFIGVFFFTGLAVSYRRSTMKEFAKAESADSYTSNRHAAQTTLKL